MIENGMSYNQLKDFENDTDNFDNFYGTIFMNRAKSCHKSCQFQLSIILLRTIVKF